MDIGPCYELEDGSVRRGYPRISTGKRKLVAAHRLAWMAIHGPIPEGGQILHRCDNRACIRGTHLYLGDHADNMRDKVMRARQWRKLDDKDLYEIEMATGRYADIAARFSVSKSTICRIKQGSQRVAPGSPS